MALPSVAKGDPHVAAHNAERQLINALQNLTDPIILGKIAAKVDEILEPIKDFTDPTFRDKVIAQISLQLGDVADPENVAEYLTNEAAQQAVMTVMPAAVAQEIETEGSPVRTALNASFAPLPGPLGRWRAQLASDPANAVVQFVGDSTMSEPHYPWTYTRLRTYYTQRGMPLYGMTPANIKQGGNSGLSLQSWLTGGAGDFRVADLWASGAHLVVLSFGINDMRLGLTTEQQMADRLRQAVELIRENLPDADILLLVPNSLTTTVVGTDYVDGITHQEVTDRLRRAYLSLRGEYPHVEIADSQSDVFGTVALATSPLMGDELHPNQVGQERRADYLAPIIGLPQKRAAQTADAYSYRRVGRVVGAGNGYIDVARLDDNEAQAKTWALSTSDALHAPGWASSPLSLSGATFVVSGNNLRILKSGDHTAIGTNTVVTIVGNHAAEGLRETATQVSIDFPSIAAGAVADVTATVTGVSSLTGVVAQPPTFMTAGLIWQAWVTAADTVTVRVYNPTGSAIDQAAGTWRFWIVR